MIEDQTLMKGPNSPNKGNSASAEKLPRLLQINSKVFKDKYASLLESDRQVFPENEPLQSYQELKETFDAADTERQNIAREIATLLAVDIPAMDNKVNGDEIWEHQDVLIARFMSELLREKVDTILMEAGTGTGKTRIMGIVLWALSRLMERGMYDKNVLIVIKRRILSLQQGIGQEAMRELAVGNEESRMHSRELRKQASYVSSKTHFQNKELFTAREWKELADQEPQTLEEAERLVIESLEERKMWKRFCLYPNYKEQLQECCLLLCRRALLVGSPNEVDQEVLEVSSEISDTGESDYFFGLSEEQKEKIYIQSDFTTEETLIPKGTRFALLSKRSLLMDIALERRKEFLAKVGFIFSDETINTSGADYQDLVTRPSVGGKESPFVLAATAHTDPMLRYKKRLPIYSVEKGVQDGVLRGKRFDSFPVNSEPLFPSGSYEAAEQLIAELKVKMQIAEMQKEPQPTDGPILITASRNIIPYLTERLKMEFGDAGYHALSYEANRDEEGALRVQVRMNDTEHKKTILVATLDGVGDSYDWPNLQTTVMGTQDTKQGDWTKRVFGRGFHSTQQGAYFMQQRFSDPTYRNAQLWNVFSSDLDIPEYGPFSHVAGQYFIGKEEREKEKPHREKLMKTAGRLWSYISKADYERLSNVNEGTFPKAIGKQRENPVSYNVNVPPLLDEKKGVDNAYIAHFAEKNCMENRVDDLKNAVQREKGTDDRFAALKKAAQQIKWEPLTKIASQAQKNIEIVREQWSAPHSEELRNTKPKKNRRSSMSAPATKKLPKENGEIKKSGKNKNDIYAQLSSKEKSPKKDESEVFTIALAEVEKLKDRVPYAISPRGVARILAMEIRNCKDDPELVEQKAKRLMGIR